MPSRARSQLLDGARRIAATSTSTKATPMAAMKRLVGRRCSAISRLWFGSGKRRAEPLNCTPTMLTSARNHLVPNAIYAEQTTGESRS